MRILVSYRDHDGLVAREMIEGDQFGAATARLADRGLHYRDADGGWQWVAPAQLLGAREVVDVPAPPAVPAPQAVETVAASAQDIAELRKAATRGKR